MTLQTLLNLFERKKGERTQWERHWQELCDYGHTRRATFTRKGVKGEKRNTKIFDTTGSYSNEVMANGLHGMLLSPSTRWFYLLNGRGRLSSRSRRWLQATEDIMYDIFNDSQTNFHSQVHELILDTTGLGTGIFQASKKGARGIYYQTRHLMECYIFENSLGVVDGMLRVFNYDSSQLIDKFPDAELAEVREELRRGKSRDWQVLHAILPKREWEFVGTKPIPNGMSHMSLYILLDKKRILREGAFKSFPFMVPRYLKRTGETYGASPMQNALPDMKTANEMVKEFLEAAQKLNRPPLMLPDSGFVGPIRTMPGALNYYRAGTQDRIEALEIGSRPELGLEMLKHVQASIMRAFYVDAFMMTDDSNGVNVKAQFVRQRRDERFRQLSPMLMRFQTEFMDPLIMRTYEMAADIGAIDDAPDELLDLGLKVGYVSPIQRAQKMEDGENLMRLMELVAPIGETDPTVWDNFNGDRIVRYGANELYNIPEQLLKSEDEVADRRRQQEEQDRMNALLSQLQGGAAGLKDVSTARKNAQA